MIEFSILFYVIPLLEKTFIFRNPYGGMITWVILSQFQQFYLIDEDSNFWG